MLINFHLLCRLVSYLIVSPIYVLDEEPSKTHITQDEPTFAHFLFEIIRLISSTTTLEGPKIFRIFLTLTFRATPHIKSCTSLERS